MLINIDSLNQRMYLKHNVRIEMRRSERPTLQVLRWQALLITMPTYHPHPDEQGRPVLLRQPHGPTPLAAWSDPDSAATVIPGGDLPRALNGIAFEAWRDAPTTDDGWNGVAGQLALGEPPLTVAPGKAPAAGRRASPSSCGAV